MIRLRNTLAVLSKFRVYAFCTNQPPNEFKTTNEDPIFKGFQKRPFQKQKDNQEAQSGFNSNKDQKKQFNKPEKVFDKQNRNNAQNEKTQNDKTHNERTHNDRTHNERTHNEKGYNEKTQDAGAKKSQPKTLFGKTPQVRQALKSQSKQFNLFIQRKQEIIQSDDQLNQQIKKLLSQNDSSSKTVSLLKLYQSQGNFQEINAIHDKYIQSNNFDANIENAYIQAISHNSKDKQAYKSSKALLQRAGSHLNLFTQETFQAVYSMIFGMPGFPNEKAVELDFLYELLAKEQMKLAIFDLSNFQLLIDENMQTEAMNAKHPKYHLKVIKVFNKYFQKLAENQKGKSLELLPNLQTIFKIAVDQAHQYQNNDEAEKLLGNLKISQQFYESHLNMADLLQFSKLLATKTDKFSVLIDICRNIKNPSFCFDLDMLIRQLDLEGKPIKCVNVEQLTQIYNQFEGKIPLRMAELICLFAERFQKYEIIADIFLNQKKQKQEESSFLYQKAINLLLDQSDGKNVSNSVMSLMQEAQNNKTPINPLNYQLNQIKGCIKEENYATAYNLFTQHIIEDVITQFQREKIKRFLYKYVQNHNLKNLKFDLKYNKEEYMQKIQAAAMFADSLTTNQLKKLYKQEKSDNYILQGIIGQKDIFQYQAQVQHQRLFERIKQELTINSYDYKRLVNTTDPDLLKEKEIIMNYEHYVSLEKQRLIAERKQERVEKLISQIDPLYFQDMKWEERVQEVYKHFTQEELEDGLLDVRKSENAQFKNISADSDANEFPEIEAVKQYQDYILKNDDPVLLNEELEQQQQQQQQQQSRQKQEIEVIEDEDFLADLRIENNLKKSLGDQDHQDDSIDGQGEADGSRAADFLVAIKKEEEQPDPDEIEVLHGTFKLFDEILDNRKEIMEEKGLQRFINYNSIMFRGDNDMQDADQEQENDDENDLYFREDNDSGSEDMDLDAKKDSYFMNIGADITDFLMMKYLHYSAYMDYNRYINVPASAKENEIWDLVAWGIKNKEPMAIKLGEYYCNITGRKMPNFMCQSIATFYKYDVGNKNSKIREKWTKSMEVTGQMSLSKIYNHKDSAFISQQEIELLLKLYDTSTYKGLARSLIKTSYSPNKYVRYGVTHRDILTSMQQQ